MQKIVLLCRQARWKDDGVMVGGGHDVEWDRSLVISWEWHSKSKCDF